MKLKNKETAVEVLELASAENAEKYITRFQQVAKHAFEEGAIWAVKYLLGDDPNGSAIVPAEFLESVKRMRAAQKRSDMLTGEEAIECIDVCHIRQRELETEVDESLKAMEE